MWYENLEAAKFNFAVEIGRDYEIPIVFPEEFDVSSLEFKSQIRDKGNNLVAEFIITKNVEENSITMLLQGDDTKDAKLGKNNFDLITVDPVCTLIYGIIEFIISVTQIADNE